MNLPPCKPLHPGAASSLETERKSNDTCTTEKSEKLSGNMANGRSVSPAEFVKEDIDLVIASTGSHEYITEPEPEPEPEPGYHISLLDRKSVQTTDSAMLVDEAANEEMQSQVQDKLEIIGNLKNPAAGPEERLENKHQEKSSLMTIVDGLKNFLAAGALEKGCANGNQIRDMLKTISEANTLIDQKKLADADKKLEPIFEYVRKSGNCSAPSVVTNLCRSKAHILYARRNVKDALTFFEKSNQFANPVIFPDRLLVLQIRSGMDMYAEEFQPEIFLEDLREWQTDDEKHQKGLSEFEKNVPQVRIFHDGIKAIFEEESADTEESRDLAAEKYKQSIAKLAEHKENGDLHAVLYHSDQILKFARNLILTKQGRFHAPSITSDKTAPYQMNHLDLYIHCHRVQKTGAIDEGIEICKTSITHRGSPFQDCLKELEREKAVAKQ